jgi:hypothetical protein
MAKEVTDYIDEIVTESGVPATWTDAMRIVQEALHHLALDRQRQYGKGNMQKFGLHGVVIRATDKVERLHTMVWSDRDDVDESIEDTAGDLANYGLFGVMLQRGWWHLPLPPKKGGEQ